jgi:tyrosine-specific transport protein
MVDRLNWGLMSGLIITYIAFAVFGITHVKPAFLEPANWRASWVALPVIFTSFSYQGIIPSLTTYLKRDAKKVRMAIIGGTSLCFLIYLLWEFLILGIVPMEALVQAKTAGSTAVEPLKDYLIAPNLVLIGQAFAFFAIATSFLGVNLGLFDFLADSLSIPKRGMRKIWLSCITFLPPLAISLVNPSLFITALVFAGGIGCALLLGFLPTLMTWVSRYRHEGHEGPSQLFGGKAMLLLLFLFVVFELTVELF